MQVTIDNEHITLKAETPDERALLHNACYRTVQFTQMKNLRKDDEHMHIALGPDYLAEHYGIKG